MIKNFASRWSFTKNLYGMCRCVLTLGNTLFVLNLLVGLLVTQTSQACKIRFNIRGRWNQISVFFKGVILFGDTITIQVSGSSVSH